MANILCPIAIDCDCETSPFANLSSEAPDRPTFFSTAFVVLTPPLGVAWDALGCVGLCESTASQEAADMCAQLQAEECVVGGWTVGGAAGPPVPPPTEPRGRTRFGFFLNTPQDGTVFCPDGLPFIFTVPAGVFGGTSQVAANARAQSFAQQQAVLHQICLGEITTPACVGVPYHSTIVATGNFLAKPPDGDFWDLVGGALPPGLTIQTGFLTGGQCLISGTPTTPGVYTFTVSIIDPAGDFLQKTYTLVIAGLTNANLLPDGAVGMSYSENVTSAGVVNPIFSVESGALPDGLSLDPGGIVFGTPTTAGDFDFVLGVTEAGTGLTCTAPGRITVTNDTTCFTDGALPNAVVGTFYQHDLHAVPVLDLGSDYTLTIVAGALPNGMFATDDFQQPQINGTPDTPGTYCFTIQLDEDPKGPAPGMPCTKQFCLTVDPLCTGSPQTPDQLVWVVTPIIGNSIPAGTVSGSATGAGGTYALHQPVPIAGTNWPKMVYDTDICLPLGGTLRVSFNFTAAHSNGGFVNGNQVWAPIDGAGTPFIDLVLPAGTTHIQIFVQVGGLGPATGSDGTLNGTFTLSLM